MFQEGSNYIVRSIKQVLHNLGIVQWIHGREGSWSCTELIQSISDGTSPERDTITLISFDSAVILDFICKLLNVAENL